MAAETTRTRKRPTVEMTKADLLSAIMDCPTGGKKAIDAYVAKIFTAKKAEKEISKPSPTIYQLFCFEQRPIITERLVDSNEYDDDNKALFGAITKELSKAWKEAKKDPKHKKGSKWYKETLALKLGNKTPDPTTPTTSTDEDSDTPSPVAKTSKKKAKPAKTTKTSKTTKTPTKPTTDDIVPEIEEEDDTDASKKASKTSTKATKKTTKTKKPDLFPSNESDIEVDREDFYESDDDIIFQRREDSD